MKRHTTFLLIVPTLLAAPVALAQTQPATPAAHEEPTTEASAAQSAEGATTQASTAQPSEREVALQEKLDALELKVGGLEEASTNAQAEIAKASKLKFSGYVQGRYEYHQDSINGTPGSPRSATPRARPRRLRPPIRTAFWFATRT